MWLTTLRAGPRTRLSRQRQYGSTTPKDDAPPEPDASATMPGRSRHFGRPRGRRRPASGVSTKRGARRRGRKGGSTARAVGVDKSRAISVNGSSMPGASEARHRLRRCPKAGRRHERTRARIRSVSTGTPRIALERDRRRTPHREPVQRESARAPCNTSLARRADEDHALR